MPKFRVSYTVEHVTEIEAADETDAVSLVEAAADLVTVRGIGHRADSTPFVDALHVLEGACLEAQEQAG